MSKRWKIRVRNAAKLERSREIIDRHYANVIAELERIKAMPTEERARLIEAVRFHATKPICEICADTNDDPNNGQVCTECADFAQKSR